MTTPIITDEMQAEQEARLQESFAGLTAAVHKCIAERDELRAVLREIVTQCDRNKVNGAPISYSLIERAEKLLENK